MDRNELKKQYKRTIKPMGIFQIKNIRNGKILIGKSKDLDAVFNKQIFELEMGAHKNEQLQKDWKEFGADSFTFEIIDRLEPKEDPEYKYDDDLKTLKELWFEKLQPYDEKGYNKKNELNYKSYT
ncbi:MAG: GIY-YIG nuclease family protein [Ignavibacteriaceae bacterium]